MRILDTFLPDKSGIYSLGGFAYQIKVFVKYMLLMEEGMQAGFETLDDVTVGKLSPETIDDNEDKFCNVIASATEIQAIQVKRTTIDEETSKKILLNWILLEGGGKGVTKYILFTDSKYGNSDIIFDTSADDLYTEVVSTTKTNRATIGKIKSKYKNDKDGFLEIYNQIKEKYEFISVSDIDEEIDNECKLLFRKAGINLVTYYGRVRELLQHITYEIIQNVNRKMDYQIGFEEMMSCIEEICNRFTDEHRYPVYAEFKKINPIDISDLQVSASREYKQLVACKLPLKMIETHLQYGTYYQNVCFGYKELNKIDRIRDIEETTYNNFEMAKIMLQSEGKDLPLNRLDATKNRPNSHAESDQIKYGSGIYLTREEEDEHKISWEDEDNEKSGN